MPIPSSNLRVCALSLMTECGPVLFVCFYMPVDSGDVECAENYIATCACITALCEDCDATQYVIAGDFNCDLCTSDSNLLSDVATNYNNAGRYC